ncbi:MAG: YfiR family protein, partial [bacterium]|nr:YfiR family protein [bacterium]
MRTDVPLKGRKPVTATIALFILLLLWPATVFFSQDSSGMEKKIRPVDETRALLIGHFARYIVWPEKVENEDKATPFIIGFIGESQSVSKCAEAIYRTKKIRDRKVEIKTFDSPQKIGKCHILYISFPLSHPEKLKEILSIVKNKPILTFGDDEWMAR